MRPTNRQQQLNSFIWIFLPSFFLQIVKRDIFLYSFMLSIYKVL